MTTPTLVLYHLSWCGFCVHVRHIAKSLRTPLSLVDVGQQPEHRERLYAETGCPTVPILGIVKDGEETLLAESRPIIAYLQANATQHSD